jgi:signal transduction histidine kinase
LGWGIAVLSNNPAKAAQAALQPVRLSGRRLIEVLDTTRLTPVERDALSRHREVLKDQLTLSQRAVVVKRYWTYGLGLIFAVVGTVLLLVAVVLARGLARQLSEPIDELVGWTGFIRRNEPLPADVSAARAPEFEALRTALREMAASLRQARSAELESERLRAFRELARRVAHEMKNPLTPVRFAIAQLSQHATTSQEEALDVLRAESTRLEQLARDFATMGRLPESPAAEVDLAELLGELARTSLPPEMVATVTVADGTPHIIGHYDPLRRAFGNLIRNAAEASSHHGRLEIEIKPSEDGVEVVLIDHGVGIPEPKRSRIFEPYFTDKADGTGLGLAIVKQAVDFHRGTIEVRETPAGGATFALWFPLDSAGGAGPSRDQPFIERRIAERRRNWR